MGKQPVTKTAIIDMLRETHGNVHQAANRLGVHRNTIHKRLAADPELREVAKTERDQLVDLAEGKLADLIEQGNIAAIIFTLKTLGRSRGWSERPPEVAVEVAPRAIIMLPSNGRYDGEDGQA
ncbi:MAG: hypothetical protein HC911_15875 [Chloroflexaceae bacterium]|nr:hypothetical protein [Chloroflexaceae bacterium]